VFLSSSMRFDKSTAVNYYCYHSSGKELRIMHIKSQDYRCLGVKLGVLAVRGLGLASTKDAPFVSGLDAFS